MSGDVASFDLVRRIGGDVARMAERVRALEAAGLSPLRRIPAGGTDGQVLTKTSAVDGETAWETPAIDRGYTVQGDCIAFNPADATTYYFGSLPILAPSTGTGSRRLFAPATGTITAAWIDWVSTGGVGTGEQIDCYLYDTDSATSTLIASIANTSQVKRFQNFAMSVPITGGTSFEFRLTGPTWVTNPLAVSLNGLVYVQTAV